MAELTGNQALEKIISYGDINTILDVGSGLGIHAQIMRDVGKTVTTNSLEPPADIVGDFFDIVEDMAPFDGIWAAHVLEHQPNPNLFLRKCYRLLREDGVLAVTVPPVKHNVVGGHVSLWNGGIMLYHAILAGFDCSQAMVKEYNYNISLIVRKKQAILPHLRMDKGDIESLSRFFPFKAVQGFNGDIKKVNWE